MLVLLRMYLCGLRSYVTCGRIDGQLRKIFELRTTLIAI